MRIEIGKRKLIDITKEELIKFILIEGWCSVSEYWSEPIVTDLNKTLFSDTLFIEYHSLRISDELQSEPICLYLNHGYFTFHIEQKGRNNNGSTHNFKLATIKYLIGQGFDLPIY